MSEAEYIRACNLARVRVLISTLRQSVPDPMYGISREEYQQIAKLLFDWEQRLEKRVKTK